MNSPLRCPVCHSPLLQEERRLVCENGHSFDLSREGYVNLMLPNQGRHLDEGGSKESLQNRKALLEKGYYSFLRERLLQIVSSLGREPFCFADLGCGEGYYTSFLAQAFPSSSFFGMDISKAAVKMLSKRAKTIPNLFGVVGNLDYPPFLDGSIDISLNCFAPICESEFRRIAKEGGYYIRVLPGVDHLMELKRALYETPRANLPKSFEMEGFSLLSKETITKTATMGQEDAIALFCMTPYVFKSGKESIEKLKTIPEMEMTLSFDIRVYRAISEK